MKKKPQISTVLFLVLLLTGLGVLLFPTFSNWYIQWQLNREIDDYDLAVSSNDTGNDQMWQDAEEYNRYLLTKDHQFTVYEEETAWISTLLNPLDIGLMGYLDIPSIDIHLPIYQGTEEKALQSGVGWWVGSSLPTGGESTHCVLTAHTGLSKSKMFDDLEQMVVGDTFTLTVLDRELTYEVDQILVVEPSDISALYIVDGEDYVTLYTCTPYGVNTHRLLVRGKRIATAEELPSAEHAARISPILILIVILLLLALIILGIRKFRKKHGRSTP